MSILIIVRNLTNDASLALRKAFHLLRLSKRNSNGVFWLRKETEKHVSSKLLKCIALWAHLKLKQLIITTDSNKSKDTESLTWVC